MGRPVWFQATLFLILAGSVRLTRDLIVHLDQARSGDDARFALLLGLRCLALAAAGWALLMAAVGRAAWPSDRGSRSPLGMVLRAGALILLTAIGVTSLAHFAAGLEGDRFAVRGVYRSVLLLTTSLWAGLLAAAPGRDLFAPRGTASRRLVVVAINLLVCLLAAETVAVWFAELHPTRLLWDERSVEATISANRFAPGATYLGFPMNSGGYYDEEFERGGADDLVVALLADSFGVGIVPYRHNFATVAERRLRAAAPVVGRVAVNNYGVAATGLPEYAWLLENEVAATSPARVVLALFVGNDISSLQEQRRPGLYSLQQFQLFELLRRLLVVGGARGGYGRTGDAAHIGRGPPADLEGGTFPEETFLEIERLRLEMCNTNSPPVEQLYRRAFSWLARMSERAGDRLVVVLVPDEFQVNDALFAALERRLPRPADYDRFYPQKRIGQFCRERGIAVLDLLEELRRAQVARPVYRPRDTHWNARGNRVAGEAIARFLLEDIGAVRD